MTKKIEKFKQYTSYLKDAIYILSILFFVYKTISNKETESALLRQTVNNNTKMIKELTEKFDKFLEATYKDRITQSELNGQIKNFIENSNSRRRSGN